MINSDVIPFSGEAMCKFREKKDKLKSDGYFKKISKLSRDNIALFYQLIYNDDIDVMMI